jgi:fructose-1,6-bisphosphatase II
MRGVLVTAPFDGIVVIGEGEKDDAPMLANGERLGSGGPACDIAVDPLDGTRLVAEGLAGSVAVIGIAPRGTMFDPEGEFYMDKLICAATDAIDIRNSATENLRAFADEKGRSVSDLVVVVLDKPRHVDLIEEIRAAGATVRLVREGDVAGAVSAAQGEVDFVMGVGGTPEGIIAACAVRALGGFMQGRLRPAGAPGRILELDELVNSDQVLFVQTEL